MSDLDLATTDADELPMRFIKAMEFMSEEDQQYISNPRRSLDEIYRHQAGMNMKILSRHRCGKYGMCVCVYNCSIDAALASFPKRAAEKQYTSASIVDVLKTVLGWHYCKCPVRGLCIEEDRYTAWRAGLR